MQDGHVSTYMRTLALDWLPCKSLTRNTMFTQPLGEAGATHRAFGPSSVMVPRSALQSYVKTPSLSSTSAWIAQELSLKMRQESP